MNNQTTEGRIPFNPLELVDLQKRISTVRVKQNELNPEYYILYRNGELTIFESRELFENVAFGVPIPAGNFDLRELSV
jgi:hypothetical protein